MLRITDIIPLGLTGDARKASRTHMEQDCARPGHTTISHWSLRHSLVEDLKRTHVFCCAQLETPRMVGVRDILS